MLQLRKYLAGQVERLEEGLPIAAGCRVAPGEEVQTVRKLECGLELIASAKTTSCVTLRICFEPPKFEAWRRNLGPVSLYFADPYGVELYYKEDVWGVSVGGNRCHFDRKREDTHDIALLTVEETLEGPEVYFARPGDQSEDTSVESSDSDEPAPADRTPNRLLPNSEDSPEGESSRPNRLLGVLQRVAGTGV